MKRIRILFWIGIILLFVPQTAFERNQIQARETANDFQYQARVNGPIRKGQIYQVVLPGAVLEKMSTELGDIRLYGPHQREIPYVMIDHVIPEATGRSFRLEIIRYQPGDDWTIIDVKNPEPLQTVHALLFEIPDRDFQKEIVLEGGDDQQQWAFIARDTLYDFTSQVDLRKVRLSFSTRAFRFFRIKMRDVAKPKSLNPTIQVQVKGAGVNIHYPDAKQILIERIDAHTGETLEAVTVYDHQTVKPLKPITEKDRKTIIDIQGGVRFERIDFEIHNPLYYRQVHIYSSETGSGDSYQWLMDGTIYQTTKETCNYLVNQFSHYPYYRFVIENKDDAPLTIKEIRLTWTQKLLCFYGQENSSAYTLHFGNPRGEAPDYDLKKLIHQDNWVQVFNQAGHSDRLTLGEPAVNPNFRGNYLGNPGNWEGWLLTVVVILLVAGLGVWLYKLFRQVPPPNP